MEKEQTPPHLGKIPEDIRLEAENRQLTMQPLHSVVIPDPEPASIEAARHTRDAPIANATNDTEQNALPIQPAKGFLEPIKPRPPLPRHIRSAVVTTLIFLLIMIAVIIVYILT